MQVLINHNKKYNKIIHLPAARFCPNCAPARARTGFMPAKRSPAWPEKPDPGKYRSCFRAHPANTQAGKSQAQESPPPSGLGQKEFGEASLPKKHLIKPNQQNTDPTHVRHVQQVQLGRGRRYRSAIASIFPSIISWTTCSTSAFSSSGMAGWNVPSPAAVGTSCPIR